MSQTMIQYEGKIAQIVQEDPMLQFLLYAGDNALITGHRCSEWCGHGPILEQDIAISNIALDYIGAARNFYQLAATRIQAKDPSLEVTEDTLAYLRDAWDFKNLLIAELPNGDWAQTTLRVYLISSFQWLFYQQLTQSSDADVAAIAEKTLKEVKYHLRWSREWVIRLGDGTEESAKRLQQALTFLWPFTGEAFKEASYETATSSATTIQLAKLHELWKQELQEVFAEANVEVPTQQAFQMGGKTGKHTEYLGYILAEMQFLQRAYPGASW